MKLKDKMFWSKKKMKSMQRGFIIHIVHEYFEGPSYIIIFQVYASDAVIKQFMPFIAELKIDFCHYSFLNGGTSIKLNLWRVYKIF